MIYEVVLREAVLKGWFVQAYADDLVVGITHIKDYEHFLVWLESWKEKVHLEINHDKTKEFRIGKFAKTTGKFQTVEKYKYLGVTIYKNRIKQCAKSRCIEEIKNIGKVPFILSWSIHKSNYLFLTWWLISYISYFSAHGIVCGFYDVDFVIGETVKRIRKISNAPPRMSNKILIEFYGLNIKNTLDQITSKIKFKLGLLQSYAKSGRSEYEITWVKAISKQQMSPKLFTSYYSEIAWKGKEKLYCKLCGKVLSFCHLRDHRKLSDITYSFFSNISECGIYKTMEKLKIKDVEGEEIIGKIFEEAKKEKAVMMKEYIK